MPIYKEGNCNRKNFLIKRREIKKVNNFQVGKDYKISGLKGRKFE